MVSNGEVKTITKLGHKKEDFLNKELLSINKYMLKRDKNGCIFLKHHKDGKYSCSIRKNRPKTCKQYPFFGKEKSIGSCLPEDMFPNVSFKTKNINQ
tara:strand:- start:7348 stop:7638 length:291 start_codon:yes stop_codon:yes gene_type:complete